MGTREGVVKEWLALSRVSAHADAPLHSSRVALTNTPRGTYTDAPRPNCDVPYYAWHTVEQSTPTDVHADTATAKPTAAIVTTPLRLHARNRTTGTTTDFTNTRAITSSPTPHQHTRYHHERQSPNVPLSTPRATIITYNHTTRGLHWPASASKIEVDIAHAVVERGGALRVLNVQGGLLSHH